MDAKKGGTGPVAGCSRGELRSEGLGSIHSILNPPTTKRSLGPSDLTLSVGIHMPPFSTTLTAVFCAIIGEEFLLT